VKWLLHKHSNLSAVADPFGNAEWPVESKRNPDGYARKEFIEEVTSDHEMDARNW
jgi:hypothetical protein